MIKQCEQCGEEFKRYGTKGRFCSKPCFYKYQQSDTSDEALLKRLWSYTELPDGVDGCWIFAGNPGVSYPLISINEYPHRVNVVSHRIGNPGDPVTAKKPFVLHACGNSRCWNPKHLRAGTPKENTADAQRHGTMKIAKCGTPSGAWSHRNKGEEICEDCRLAVKIYDAERRLVKNPKTGKNAPEAEHGTCARYKTEKCRCTDCKAANNRYERERLIKKKARGDSEIDRRG